jgi:hypothetical protein
METSASEPLMTCRNVREGVKTGEGSLPRDRAWGEPVYCPGGARHGGGVNLIPALVRNVGTCRPDAKGDGQAGSPREPQSTDAGHRGGATCSSKETSVMVVERRGRIVRPYLCGQPIVGGAHG